MTRKNNSKGAPEQKVFKPHVLRLTSWEDFNWLHSRRTPEEKRRDAWVAEQIKKQKELRLEDERSESEELSKSTEP